MLRNLAYHTLTLLASLMILAHAIIPHHHHQDHICFELSFLSYNHQINGNHGGHDACCAHNHQHDTPASTTCSTESLASFNHTCSQIPDPEHDTSGCCQLTEMLVYTPASYREEVFCPVRHLKHHDLPRLFLPDTGVQQGFDLHAVTIPFRQTPYLFRYSPNNATHTPGLRAPPVC